MPDNSEAAGDKTEEPIALSAPRIAYLGVSEKTTFVREGHPVLWRYNVIGLRKTLVHFVYPCGLHGWSILLACHDPFTLGTARVRIVTQSGEQLCQFDLTFETSQTDPTSEASTETEKREWRIVPAGPDWQVLHTPLDRLTIPKPGCYPILVSVGGEETQIGSLDCVVATPPPLTEDRIAAIRANPKGAKLVRAVCGCKKCPSKLYVIAGIERPKDLDGKEKIWYEDVPEEWRCGCGVSVIDLTLVRTNLHGYLGTEMPSPEIGGQAEIGFIRMYEKGSLTDLCAEFGAQLDDEPREPVIQKFLEANTVFLHRFSPAKIRPQAPLLTKRSADFAILDTRGVLVLVEIERADIKLLKKGGDMAQALQHAFDQVRTWFQILSKHREAVLDCIGFKSEEVAGVRGVVIAGRDAPYPSEHLMRLKGTDYGQIEFYTYDDLLEDTVNLTREL